MHDRTELFCNGEHYSQCMDCGERVTTWDCDCEECVADEYGGTCDCNDCKPKEG